ncbi:MAG: carboxymuconolactone decarboxylase [Alcanivorax sp.]|nr:carboxymuconolactone decarboxylase [Alcanivorax sp.]MAY09282.1 carboxymuconolactone decarboxylase [Alcanivorax sp.]MBI54829.1 carboxymuconolactone decarboxylase [Alcanivorax sp.]HCE41094.1 carboxymuconolactone decarboxylase [Alcanivorax sp.]|tara:strand:- start:197 stop:832 length:636 start_codon:yes stop_codon:yes gene_type:complete
MSNDTLTPRQRALVALSSLAAKGDLERLDGALRQGLDDGLTINEIKEVLVQLYAYAGFPRSLNAIHALMAVLDERREQGIQDEEGAEPSPVPEDLDRDDYGARVRARLAGQDEIPPPAGFQLFAPVIDRFLKEHLFADIFVRDNLDHQSRELATVSALASMTGTEGQLRFHLGAAMNTGLSRAQLDALVAQLRASVGEEEASRAKGVLEAL